jgi:hypothetical protein
MFYFGLQYSELFELELQFLHQEMMLLRQEAELMGF